MVIVSQLSRLKKKPGVTFGTINGSSILNSYYLKSGKSYSAVVNKTISTGRSGYKLVNTEESDGWKYSLQSN